MGKGKRGGKGKFPVKKPSQPGSHSYLLGSKYLSLKRPPKHERERIKSLMKHSPLKPKTKHEVVKHSAKTVPYKQGERILTVGEGDLSFAHGLAARIHSTEVPMALMATVFEDEKMACEIHRNTRENAAAVTRLGGKVMYGVDATKLSKYPAINNGRGWQKIVFNFPHLGEAEKDEARNVRAHQDLLVRFFTSAKTVLDMKSCAEIHVTIKDGPRYAKWDLVKIATKLCGLDVLQAFHFSAENYPPYKHCKTTGLRPWERGDMSAAQNPDQSNSKHPEQPPQHPPTKRHEDDDEFIGAAKTYVFVPKEVNARLRKAALAKQKKKKSVSRAELEDDMSIKRDKGSFMTAKVTMYSDDEEGDDDDDSDDSDSDDDRRNNERRKKHKPNNNKNGDGDDDDNGDSDDGSDE